MGSRDTAQRWIRVLALSLLAAPAHADAPSDIELVLRANVEAIARSSEPVFAATLRPDATLVLPAGQGEMDSLAERFYGRRVAGVTHTLGTPVFLFDPAGRTAWFHVAVAVTYQPMPRRPSGTPRATMYVTGVATRDVDWRLVTAMYALAAD